MKTAKNKPNRGNMDLMKIDAVQIVDSGNGMNVWGLLTKRYPEATSDEKLKAVLAAQSRSK